MPSSTPLCPRQPPHSFTPYAACLCAHPYTHVSLPHWTLKSPGISPDLFALGALEPSNAGAVPAQEAFTMRRRERKRINERREGETTVRRSNARPSHELPSPHAWSFSGNGVKCRGHEAAREADELTVPLPCGLHFPIYEMGIQFPKDKTSSRRMYRGSFDQENHSHQGRRPWWRRRSCWTGLWRP